MIGMALQKYDFGNNIGYIINRAARAFVGALDSELREKVGVTAGKWKVLAVLVDQNGLTQKEIAERLALDGTTLIPIIDKMEKDNLVIRKTDQADRRNNRIYRTEMADLQWHKMMECALNIKEISLKGISDENVKIMKDVLENIWYNLRLYFDVDCDEVKKSHHEALPVRRIKKRRISTGRIDSNGSEEKK